MTQDNNGNGESCHFIDGIVAVPQDQMSAAMELIGAEGSGRLPGLLAGIDGEIDEEIVNALSQMIGLLEVGDPHEAAEQLANSGVPASPIHAVGFQGHTKAMAGTEPEEVQVAFPDVPEGGENNIVAMVDSGIAERLPGWMAIVNDQIDIEAPDSGYAVPASHGTFVASILRQISPDHVVSLGAARADQGELTPPPHDGGNPTNELQVAAAILRLIRRHREHPEQVKALNLSLGAYACHPDRTPRDSQLLAMRAALRRWIEEFPGVPIFAAGGNSTSPDPVYPGAWGNELGNEFKVIHAVAAGRANSEVVWDAANVETAPPSSRDWITDGAWGSDVVGLSGQDNSHAIKWSGSSFATAVATASLLKGESSTLVGNVTWWSETVDGLSRV